ncbi:MAG: hypothetical protein ACRCRT_00505 [Cetobacterium somerae]
MKTQIRRQVFESNSSSTHSLTMCLEQDYDKWEAGELFFKSGWGSDEKFVTPEDIKDIIEDFIENKVPDLEDYDDLPTIPTDKTKYLEYLKENDLDEEFEAHLENESIYTYNSYETYHEDYEHFAQTHKTPSGDTIVAFGYYGYC